MNILAITYCYAPMQVPATYRLLKWFVRLRECGHDVTVLGLDSAEFGFRSDLESLCLHPEGLRLVLAPSRGKSALYRVLKRMDNLCYWLFEPDRMEWYEPAKRAALALPLERYDVVLSCSHPPVCHLLGLHLNQQHGIPWVSFFSDPWTGGPYDGKTGRRRQRNARLEQEVVVKSYRVLVTCEEMQRLMKRRYPDLPGRFQVLPHSYNVDWYDQNPAVPLPSSSCVEVLYTGSFYGPRSAVRVLEALRDVHRCESLRERLRLHIYGTMDESDSTSQLLNELEGVVIFHGLASYRQTLAMMKRADYLLLIDAPIESGQESVFFPSKLADYLGAGTPIIGVTPGIGASARVLRETGHMVCSIDDREQIKSTIMRMAERDQMVAPIQEAVVRYDYRRVGDALARTLADAAGAHRL